jgi:hypothetical protein
MFLSKGIDLAFMSFWRMCALIHLILLRAISQNTLSFIIISILLKLKGKGETLSSGGDVCKEVVRCSC